MQAGIRILFYFIAFLVFISSGCQTTYYSIWEKLGKEKRHLLRDKVSQVQTEQEMASEEFKDVLTRLKEIYGFQGGELESFYNRLRDNYEACEKRAQNIEERIEQVEIIARDLFQEWESEIDQIVNANIKTQSRKTLADTKSRYVTLKKTMDRAEASMKPVLTHLKDYVLYLKHNLNAQAIGSLKQEVNQIELEVGTLIRDMEVSIGEAETFLRDLK